MPKLRFDQIAVNSKEKKKPVESDKDTCIGLEHLDSGVLEVTRWGSEVAPIGDKLVMRKGDILFGRRRAYQKKVAIAPFDGIFSAHGMVLRPKTDVVTPEFFPFFISSDYFLDAAINISVGSLSPTINWRDLREFEFNIPTIEEQNRVSGVLWGINRLRAAYTALLNQTDELVRSQFIEMFGDPMCNPKGYHVQPLVSLGELGRGVSKARPRNKPELLGGPYPLIQTGEITAAELYIDSFESTYSEAGLAQSKMWPKGTLCITIAANIAQTAILRIDACFPDSVVGFVSNGTVNPVYVHYWFSFYQSLLDAQATQVAQKNINLKTLSELQVMIPTLDEQQRFISFVEHVDKSKFCIQFAEKILNVAIKVTICRGNMLQ